MGFFLDMFKRDREIKKREKARQKAAREQEKAEARLPGLIAKTDDPGLLCRYYRETKKDETRFTIYEKLTRKEPVVSFGEMDWFVLKQEENRQLLLSRCLPGKYLPFARGLEGRKNYEGEGWYITYPDLQWSSSELRRYLNGEFTDRFSAEEKSRILPVRIGPDPEKSVCLKNEEEARAAGSGETDHVFLLSRTEIRECAENRLGIRIAFTGKHTVQGWWTRTVSQETSIEHGHWKPTACCCSSSGDPEKNPDFQSLPFDSSEAVRPVLWISCP